MRFALRDDDTNFFTTPEILTACYEDIWDVVPPSLCVITKVKGNWVKWLEHIYQNRQDSDWQAWQEDDAVSPIEKNEQLISFLKEKLTEKKIDVCFHAKHHRNSDKILPDEIPGNYIRNAEYFTNEDRSAEIKEEVRHLSSLLNYKISVFTPPQNLLSPIGYQSVLNAGLNLCGGGMSFYKKQKDIKGLIIFLKQLSFKLLYRGDNYPFVLYFSSHSEIPYHYTLQPNTHLDTLIKNFEAVRKFDGDFVLSTHYAEFDYKMEYNTRLSMKNVLYEFLNYISKYDVAYTTLSNILKVAKPAA